MADQGPPALTDSDHSAENSSDSEMEGTSDYGSKTGNDDSDRSDSEEGSQEPPINNVEALAESISAEDLRREGNGRFNEGNYTGAIEKYKEAVKAGGGNIDNKVKCYSNISHCLNRRKKYSEALDYAFKAIETMPEFGRVYVRCAEAFNNLEEPKMAAIALMKGEAWGPTDIQSLRTELNKIEKTVKEEAKKYIARYHNNLAKDINLKKLREKGFKKDDVQQQADGEDEEQPRGSAAEIPGLVGSTGSSSSPTSGSEAPMEGGGPSSGNGTRSPKKKKKSSQRCNRSADDSSDDESSPKGKRLTKKAVELIKKDQDEQLRKQIEEVKRTEEAKVAALLKKEELDKKKKAEESKRKEEERKKVIAVNDPKEIAWMQFNDILAEASSCFRRNIPIKSMEKFAEALDIIGRSFKDLKFKTKNMNKSDEVVVIKYMFARACNKTNNYTDIITGYSKLKEIVMIHKEIRFPAVHLGFALMFKKLNRYDEALIYVDKGLDFFDKNLPCVSYNYPGLASEPIEETRPDFLEKTFQSLRLEFKCPPKPEAICKYKECLVVNKNNHIIPSENIYLTDPDYKGYYKIWCRLNCVLDFHENCWVEKKNDYIDVLAKTNKTPTEKDFFGLNCFTPDCEGIIIKIQIYDAYGEVKTIEDKKLMEKIESEERNKREEEKRRKEKEAKDAQQRKLEEKIKKSKKRKERNKSSPESDSAKENKTEPPKVIIPNKVAVPSNLADKVSTPPPDIPLDYITIHKKNKDSGVEDEIVDKKRNKKKERNTLHLAEFNNSDIPPTETGFTDPRDYKDRIARLAAVKKSYEEQSFTPVHQSTNTVNSALEEKMDKYLNLNPNASVFNPNPVEQMPPDVIEESIKSFVFQTLKDVGPLKETDSRFSKEFGTEANALIVERRGLVNLLKSDERFGSYDDYICLKGDAEKAKKMKDQDIKITANVERKPANLGDMARKIREQLEKDKENVPETSFNTFGLLKASKEASILDTIKKDADAGAKGPPIAEIRALSIRTLGVQTDVSSLDLDELDDPIVLKQSNSVLLSELQESKDKLYQVQNQRKVETKEMNDQVKALIQEKNKVKSDNNNLNETIQKMNKSYRDSVRKEEELKRVKESLESEQHKNGLIQTNLNNTKLKLENEQRLSFQLQSQLQSQREQEMSMIKTLKLRFLKTEFDGKKALLMNKNLENEKLIGYLANMNSNESNQTNVSAIKSSMDKLNEFSAKLFNGLETLQARYDEKVRQVEQSPGSLTNVELNFDTSSLESPQLTSIEVDTLRLLTSVSLNNTSRPPGAPFAGLPNTSRPPPSRPLGRLGPPPGLPPKSDSGNPPTDSLTTIRAAITRPRTASSPRPAPAALTRSAPPPSGAAASQAVGGAGAIQAVGGAAMAVGPIGPPTPAPSGPRNKSYQKLLTQLQGRYTDLSQPDAERYIHLLRESNNGKLSGMSIQSIFDRVGAFMRTDRERRRVENDTDNNCSICLEDMHDRDSRRLNPCEHKFHNACIDHWLSTPGGAGNTCPMCRHYIIQEEEFPDLGHRGHRRH